MRYFINAPVLRVLLLCVCTLLSLYSSARTVTDQGDGLNIEGIPQRIVVLEYSFLDAVVLAGISPTGIADDQRPERILPEIRQQLEDYTSVGLRGQPDLETIASLKPDLIIADKYRHEAIYKELKKIAPTLLLRSYGAEYSDLLEDTVTIGAALGKPEEINRALALHNQRMDALSKQITEGAGDGINNQSLLFAVTNHRAMTLHGSKAFASGVMRRLGLQHATPVNDERAYIQIGFEQLLEMNPQWLIIGDYSEAQGGSDILNRWQQHPLWQHLNAIKSDHQVRVDPKVWALGRGVMGAERIAADLSKALKQQ
ncbi:Fe(3+) dicitrate ABC transporter substrate-binding protein [Aliamphritea spongicola]|uniref:Fe(3+) dicitrate ABC transporter substrate-binding protein n=1 Tax=Aliamphritea spongicola TaxID=707589 RepID=UPI00196A3A04|nr:Fe(3+) dicitrate ABC transporter substrate-binding protein [Aliamphritea spongicola]MBN3561150.1 ABC transporter substrate-binding protein [Aliamphritea spongicola]